MWPGGLSIAMLGRVQACDSDEPELECGGPLAGGNLPPDGVSSG